MPRPTRDTLDRQIRATLVLYGVPHEAITESDGRARFDAFHERVISDHVSELDRLWSLAEDTEQQLARDTSIRNTVDRFVRFGVAAEPDLMHTWPERDRAFMRELIAACPATDGEPEDLYVDIGGEG